MKILRLLSKQCTHIARISHVTVTSLDSIDGSKDHPKPGDATPVYTEAYCIVSEYSQLGHIDRYTMNCVSEGQGYGQSGKWCMCVCVYVCMCVCVYVCMCVIMCDCVFDVALSVLLLLFSPLTPYPSPHTFLSILPFLHTPLTHLFLHTQTLTHTPIHPYTPLYTLYTP